MTDQRILYSKFREEMVANTATAKEHMKNQTEKIENLKDSVARIEEKITTAFDGVNLKDMQKKVEYHSRVWWGISRVGSLVGTAIMAIWFAFARDIFK